MRAVRHVTQHQEEALVASGRCIVTDRGRIVQQGLPDRSYEAPTNRFLAGFIVDTYLVDGKLVARDRALRLSAVAATSGAPLL